MFSDTLLSLFQPSLQFPDVAVCTTGPFSCFCALCCRSLGCLSTSLKVCFLFLLQWGASDRFCSTERKFPSIQSVDINPVVYGILSVKFAFFVRIDNFPPTIKSFSGHYGFVSNAFCVYDLW